MPLKLRPTGLASPAYRDQPDFRVVSGEFVVGRIYEDRAAAQPECRWFWAINGVHAGPAVMDTTGRAATFEHAKARFADNWRKWLVWARLREIE